VAVALVRAGLQQFRLVGAQQSLMVKTRDGRLAGKSLARY
jgi:hypothetical protein